jgi:hypothetical protein
VRNDSCSGGLPSSCDVPVCGGFRAADECCDEGESAAGDTWVQCGSLPKFRGDHRECRRAPHPAARPAAHPRHAAAGRRGTDQGGQRTARPQQDQYHARHLRARFAGHARPRRRWHRRRAIRRCVVAISDARDQFVTK